jgi:hypothetical protein
MVVNDELSLKVELLQLLVVFILSANEVRVFHLKFVALREVFQTRTPYMIVYG